MCVCIYVCACISLDAILSEHRKIFCIFLLHWSFYHFIENSLNVGIIISVFTKIVKIFRTNTKPHFSKRVQLFWMLIIYIIWSTIENRRKKHFFVFAQQKRIQKCENMICYHCYRKCDAKIRSIQRDWSIK